MQFHKLGVTLLAETPDQEPARACRLRPREPRVLEVPCVEVVDVYCLDDGVRRPRWVCDDAWPGVKVVEGPVNVGPGKVVVAIEPGVRAVITGTRVPWQVREVPPEVAARAAISAQLTQEFGRRQAQASSDRAGCLLNEHGEKVLSVRLHEKCDHKADHWERKTCGHVWCKMCNGHGHPGTRVALKGVTDIVKCSRKWHKLDEYQYSFGRIARVQRALRLR